jgi:hypothetical protein
MAEAQVEQGEALADTRAAVERGRTVAGEQQSRLESDVAELAGRLRELEGRQERMAGAAVGASGAAAGLGAAAAGGAAVAGAAAGAMSRRLAPGAMPRPNGDGGADSGADVRQLSEVSGGRARWLVRKRVGAALRCREGTGCSTGAGC